MCGHRPLFRDRYDVLRDIYSMCVTYVMSNRLTPLILSNKLAFLIQYLLKTDAYRAKIYDEMLVILSIHLRICARDISQSANSCWLSWYAICIFNSINFLRIFMV